MNMQVRNKEKSATSAKAKRKTKRPAQAAGACCPQLEATIDPRLFKALSDPTRISILVNLATCCGPQTVTQAAGCCCVDLSVVSRHLGILRDAGVLTVQKKGREMYYTVRYDELCRTLRQLADALAACCPAQQ
jgi:ArsR family transcriptional regulator